MIYTSIPKRKTKKPTAAQVKLAAEWDAIQKKYSPKTALKSTASKKLEYKLTTPPGRTTTYGIPSRDTGGVALKKETMQYTGNNILGIGTLHKSNAVPVFSQDEAKEIARMRRG